MALAQHTASTPGTWQVTSACDWKISSDETLSQIGKSRQGSARHEGYVEPEFRPTKFSDRPCLGVAIC